MTQANTITVRIKGQLSDFVAANIGDQGSYDNVSEYIRDLIRRDKERVEMLGVEALKAELKLAFDAPESSYQNLTAQDIINRNKPTA